MLTRYHHQSVPDIMAMPLWMFYSFAEAAFKQLREEFKQGAKR